VRAVANGLQALRALRDEPFGCVLLDVLMPEMDGYQVLEHIRRDPKLRRTPVIMISALGTPRASSGASSFAGRDTADPQDPRPCRTSSSPRENTTG
jgi:CheY-like chemotaxis protein